MENNNKNNTTRGVSLSGVSFFLTLLFLILKLCKVIDWPWVFVFLPIIISAGLVVLILIIVFILALISSRLN